MIQVYLTGQTNVLDYIYAEHKDYDISHYQADEISLMQIYKEYFSSNLLSTKKIIVIENPLYLINKSNKLKKKEVEIFEQILKNKTENKIVYLLKKPLNKTIDYIKNNIENIEYEKDIQQSQEKKFLKDNKINISTGALTFLKENLHEDYDYLQELFKLGMYKGQEEITVKDIKENVKLKIEVDIFNMIEAIVKKDNKVFLQTYSKLKEEENIKEESVLAIMYTQLKFYISVKVMREQNFTDNNIVSKLKCSPYRLKFSNKLVNSITLKNFIEVNEKVALYDYLIKSGKTKEKNVLFNFLI